MGDGYYKADLVSEDNRYIGEVKWIDRTDAGANLSAIEAAVWRLQNVTAEKKFIVFNFGAKKDIEKFLKRFSSIVVPVGFYYFDLGWNLHPFDGKSSLLL